MDLDIDHLRGWIGNSETMSERLTLQLVERFNATLDIEEDAVAGAEAPQMIHLCLAQPVAPASRLGHDGHPKRGGFLPPVSLPPDVGGRRDRLPRAASDRRDSDVDIAD